MLELTQLEKILYCIGVFACILAWGFSMSYLFKQEIRKQHFSSLLHSASKKESKDAKED
jgi:hypothetical protein